MGEIFWADYKIIRRTCEKVEGWHEHLLSAYYIPSSCCKRSLIFLTTNWKEKHHSPWCRDEDPRLPESSYIKSRDFKLDPTLKHVFSPLHCAVLFWAPKLCKDRREFLQRKRSNIICNMLNMFAYLVRKSTWCKMNLFFFQKSLLYSNFIFYLKHWSRKSHLDGCKRQVEIAAFATIKSTMLLVMTFSIVVLLF